MTATPDITDANRLYRPQGAALDLFYCRKPEVLIEGPAGTGKTRAVLEKVGIVCDKYPGARVLLVRKTRESMTHSVLETWESQVLPPGHPALAGPDKRFRSSYRYPNGSEIVVGGLDKASRIMSSEYSAVCAFEATELTLDDWETLQTRLRDSHVPYRQGIADCNPAQPTHWLNVRAASGKMTRLLSRHSDNPSVTPAYLATLEGLTGIRRARLYEGKWAAAEGMVYEGWNTAVHLVDRFQPPAEWRRIRVIDFGFTAPFVCLWLAIDPEGRAYVYREWYKTRMLVEDHAKIITDLSRGESIEATVADHDAEDRATLERHGIATIPAVKAILPGLEAVASRLRAGADGKPRLMVMRDSLVEPDGALLEARKPICLAQEFEGYSWPKTADGKTAKEVPVKVDDHALDALRYAVAYQDGLGGMALDVRLMDGNSATAPRRGEPGLDDHTFKTFDEFAQEQPYRTFTWR